MLSQYPGSALFSCLNAKLQEIATGEGGLWSGKCGEEIVDWKVRIIVDGSVE